MILIIIQRFQVNSPFVKKITQLVYENLEKHFIFPYLQNYCYRAIL